MCAQIHQHFELHDRIGVVEPALCPMRVYGCMFSCADDANRAEVIDHMQFVSSIIVSIIVSIITAVVESFFMYWPVLDQYVGTVARGLLCVQPVASMCRTPSLPHMLLSAPMPEPDSHSSCAPTPRSWLMLRRDRGTYSWLL